MIVGSGSSTPPLVSVIVPAYGSARTIERCLAALAAQETTHPFEVLVVDSGTDDTCELARRALPAVRTIRLPSRAVAPTARNVGAREARGEILAFVDSDAYADTAWIENVVRVARTDYDLVCGSIGNANPHSAVARAEQLLMFNEFLSDLPERPMWFALSGNMVLPRRSYERFGPFVDVRAAEDVVFSRKLVDAGGRVLFSPALHVFHDNRTRLRPFLRNQFVVGKHTAIARRLVSFSGASRYWVFLLLLPIAPVAKLAKIALRMAVTRPRHLLQLVANLPLLGLGLCAYSAGMIAGAASEAAVPEPIVDRIDQAATPPAPTR